MSSMDGLNVTQQGIYVCPDKIFYDRSGQSATQAWERTDLTANRQIISGYMDSSRYSRVYVDGKPGDATQLSQTVSTSDGYIEVGSLFEGYIQEILVFNKKLNSSQMASVNLYLSKKWQVSPRRMDSDSDGIPDLLDPNNGIYPCTACQPGETTTGNVCRTCQAGKFSDNGGQCSWCPSSATSLPGSKSVAFCACGRGYYRKSLSECALCPAGFYCPQVCGS